MRPSLQRAKSDSDVRITLRFSAGEFADLDAAAEAAGVATGAAARLAVIRAFHGVCRDVSAGRVRVRRRSSSVPVRAAAAEVDLSGKIDLLAPDVPPPPLNGPRQVYGERNLLAVRQRP